MTNPQEISAGNAAGPPATHDRRRGRPANHSPPAKGRDMRLSFIPLWLMSEPPVKIKWSVRRPKNTDLRAMIQASQEVQP